MSYLDNDYCRLCGRTYDSDSDDDRALHVQVHKKLAKGAQPRKVRDFAKDFGWAIAFGDRSLDPMKMHYNSDLGKLVVAYSWWSRALVNGVPVRDFERFMDAHLAFAEARVAGECEIAAKEGIREWQKYAG